MRRDEPGEAAGQVRDGVAGALAVGEAERREPGLDGAGPGQQLGVGAGEGLEQRTEVEALVDGAHDGLVPRQRLGRAAPAPSRRAASR